MPILRSTAVFASVFVLGCSSADEPPASEKKTDTHDEALTVHVETATNTVPAGAETMTCEYMEPLERDLVVTGFGTKQARGGHHLVLYKSVTQRPPGTIEDCTNADSMTNLLLALTQITAAETSTASIEFPEKMVAVLPKGTQLVTQSHYINTTNDDLVANDQVDIWLTEEDPRALDVLHLFVAGTTAFEIPAHTEGYAARVGCTLPHDVDLVSMIPHMHEWGAGAHVKIGDPGDMKVVFDHATWEPSWRDVPPITTFLDGDVLSSAGHFAAGQSVELECRWANSGSSAIGFPNEMCAAVGYFLTDAKDAVDVMCLTPLQ